MQIIPDLLNSCHSVNNWHQDNIVKAFRLGKPRVQGSDARPVLVQFSRWFDKVAVLGGPELRDSLRQYCISVASDRTSRQKEMVECYRNQGKIAFIYNGRLQVRDRQNTRSRFHEEHYRHNHATESVMETEDWPQIHSNRQNGRDRVWNRRPPTGYSNRKIVENQRIKELLFMKTLDGDQLFQGIKTDKLQ
ncbi:hypothetical protein ACOMHN_020051 [Nucella lapillus]